MEPFIDVNKPMAFSCTLCNFHTLNRKDYKKHIETLKHKKAEAIENNTEPVPERKISCICGKIFKTENGLYKHKKKCVSPITPPQNSQSINDKLIMFLLKQNLEHQFTIMELNKKVETLTKE